MTVLDGIINGIGIFIIAIVGYAIIRLTLEQIVDSFMTLVIQYLFQIHGTHFTFDSDAIDNISRALAVIIYLIVFLKAFWPFVLFTYPEF